MMLKSRSGESESKERGESRIRGVTICLDVLFSGPEEIERVSAGADSNLHPMVCFK